MAKARSFCILPADPRGAVITAIACAVCICATARPVSAQLQESKTSDGSTSSGGDSEEDPMAWFGVGLKLGAGGVGSSHLELDYGQQVVDDAVELAVDTDSRLGFQASIPIYLGGGGLGWVFEPYTNLDRRVTALGAYTGPTINIQVARPVYLGVGAGLKVAYLSAKFLDGGVDIGGRIPFSVTAYALDDLALVAEVGIGYTATGYSYKAEANGAEPDMAFGGAFAWDASLGVRWP